MGFDLSGYVLRPVRSAGSNASSTGEAVSGVSRDHISPAEMTALGYDAPPIRDVEPYADMYRAAVLQNQGVEEHYLVWAASTGPFSTTPDMAITGDVTLVNPTSGTLSVSGHDDGTDRFIVRDAQGRDIASVTSLILQRGETSAEVTSTFSFKSGWSLILDSSTLTNLGGGFSSERGDAVISITYTLRGAEFWWSKNDATTRFGWSGSKGRWEPLKGSVPILLGVLKGTHEDITLNPPPQKYPAGRSLPGDPDNSDSFAVIRAGQFPDSTSKPLSVISVASLGLGYPSEGLGYDAVLHAASGVLRLNPEYGGAGLKLWYSPEEFQRDSDGDLGVLAEVLTDTTYGSPCLAPVPGPTDRPMVRIGFRKHLNAVVCDRDEDLPASPEDVDEGDFFWSRTTGKILLSATDIRKAIPGEAEYDLQFLGARIYFDGVSLNTKPMTLRNPALCLNADGEELTGAGGPGIPSTGDLYTPRALPLPPPGKSGVTFIPDGTGANPDLNETPGARPGPSGLVRSVTSIGESWFFTESRSFPELKTTEWDQDLIPQRKTSQSEVQMALQEATDQPVGNARTSRVQVKRRGVLGESLRFIQADVTPAVYSDEARIYSRRAEPFTISGTEILKFVIDGTGYAWNAASIGPQESATAVEIAASLNEAVTGAGSVYASHGRIVIESGDVNIRTSGTVEIGWNTNPDDLSGHAALGFLPGWRVDASGDTFRWQPDSGSSIGLFRSPIQEDSADVRAVGRTRNKVLTGNLSGVPFFHLSAPPLEDVPGFSDGSHFKVSQGIRQRELRNFDGVKYDFTNDRLIWISEGTTPLTSVVNETALLQIGSSYLLPESLSSEAIGSGYGVHFRDAESGSEAIELVRGVDYDLDEASGILTLTEPVSPIVSSGGGGYLSGSVFTNPELSPIPSLDLELQTALYNTIQVGYLLQILDGEAKGVYTITAKTPEDVAEFTVHPAFTSAGGPHQWMILEAQNTSVYDPGIVADVVLREFNHHEGEPWLIARLTPLGIAGQELARCEVQQTVSLGRAVSLRFGTTVGEVSSVPTILTPMSVVGVVGLSGLTIPSTPHFERSDAEAYFKILIGGFEPILGLVDEFSEPITGVEVGRFGSGIEREVRFSDDILERFDAEDVQYQDTLIPSDILMPGESEIDPRTGMVSLATSDLAQHEGEALFLIEWLILEGQKDVTVNPMNGSFLLREPLQKGQMVETRYFTSDSSGGEVGDLIAEYLPFQTRLEVATRVNGHTYTFNPEGRSRAFEGTEQIWVGPSLMNFAGVHDAGVTGNEITFNTVVDEALRVRINYETLEASGGEQAFTVSTPPVARPPFFLKGGQSRFELSSDRTSEVEVGQLILIGSVPFYVRSVDFADSLTTVEIWPTPSVEVGSRSPGRGSGIQVSNRPVAIEIDPEGDPVVGGGSTGFLMVADAQIRPIAKGQMEVLIHGDVRAYARPGHIIEVSAHPYLVHEGYLTEDGEATVVRTSSPFRMEHDETAVIRLSARPVFIAGATEIPRSSPFIEAHGHRLFRLHPDQPGQELVRGVDYETTAESGSIVLSDSMLMADGSRLVAAYVAEAPVGPRRVGGAVMHPTFKAKYLKITTPSLENGLLGSTLLANFDFNAPDSFLYGVTPMEKFAGEVTEKALANLGSVASGAYEAYPGEVALDRQGVLGPRGKIKELKTYDRGARAYLDLLNQICVGFEQVLEEIDGRQVGDGDGKFKFFVGRGLKYAPPGYEDQITGELNPRSIWGELVREWSGEEVFVTEDDPVFNPSSVRAADVGRPGLPGGRSMNPATLRFFIAQQKERVKNDLDDRVLVGMGAPKGILALNPGVRFAGKFSGLWQPSKMSRIYPEEMKHLSRLMPGIDAVEDEDGSISDPGYFTAGRRSRVEVAKDEFETQTLRTHGSAIGGISNPAVGRIAGIVEVTIEDRLPRSRVYRYYPSGSVELDSELGVATLGKATVVASQVTLDLFPTDPSTGNPDPTQLITEGGVTQDLNSGDPDLAAPRFEVGQRVGVGTTSGGVYDLTDAQGDGIFVTEVLRGCILILGDKSGAPLLGSDILANESQSLDQVLSDGGRGATIFVGAFATDVTSVPAESDSPTLAQMGELTKSVPSYRTQFDLKVGKRSGDLIDASLPVIGDTFPFPMQKMFGQKPPKPLACVSGVVEVVSTSVKPLKVPSLQGQYRDDSGDEQIPYRSILSERSVLSEISASFRGLMGSDSVAAPYTPIRGETQSWAAIYPDEIPIADGHVYGEATGGWDPATLYSAANFGPVNGTYEPASALGDLRSFDLLLIEADQVGVPAGLTGIQTIGHSAGLELALPRFVSIAALGDVHRYTLRNAVGHLGGTFPATSGVAFGESFSAPSWSTTINVSTVTDLVLSSGLGFLAGGFLAVAGDGNCVTLGIYDPDPNGVHSFLGAIVIPETLAGRTIYVWNDLTQISTAVTLNGSGVTYLADNIIQIQSVGQLLPNLPGVAAGRFDFTVSVDTFVDVITSGLTAGALAVGSAEGSTTCEIERDRLTFSERVNMSFAKPRGTTPANGEAIELGAQLSVWEISTAEASDITVNAPDEVNGGEAFTFLERIGPGASRYVGTFIPGFGTERGKIRAMSWEGQGNEALAFTGLRASGVPSSNLDETGVILSGSGFIPDGSAIPLLTQEGPRCWVQNLTTDEGGLPNVKKGDILVVDAGATGKGAVKTGTYLVRHTVEMNATSDGGVEIRGEAHYTDAGAHRFFDLTFPTLRSRTSSQLVMAGVHLDAFPDPLIEGSSQWLYVVNSKTYASYALGEYTLVNDSVYRAEYSEVSYENDLATFTLTGDYQDASGSSITEAQFALMAVSGRTCSGMWWIPVAPAVGLPPNNIVGCSEDPAGNGLSAGFLALTIGNRNSTVHSGTTVEAQTWDKRVAANQIERILDPSDGLPTAGSIGVLVPAGASPTEYQEDSGAAIYGRRFLTGSLASAATEGVPMRLNLGSLTEGQWESIHFDTVASVPNNVLQCLLPFDRIVTGDALDLGASVPGFFAIAGVFLEPSFARSASNLTSSVAHVVSRSFSGTLDQVGARDLGSFTATTVVEEGVSFSVRRIRRFHEAQQKITAQLEGLRFLYESRTGSVQTYQGATRTVTLEGSRGATNLGNLDEPRLNIHAGDILQILDADGSPIYSSEIQAVIGPNQLVLRKPGLEDPEGSTFRIQLSQAPVPLEQSHSQLLDLLTEKRLRRKIVNYQSIDGGGRAPDVNKLRDSDADWEGLGVQAGDYVRIPSAGSLIDVDEVGSRPYGDLGVTGRSGYVAGGPAPLDDNRGFYKVVQVDGVDLIVDGTSRFSGGPDDVIFGEDSASYSVLPTVGLSGLTDGVEEQQALRPTAPPVGSSFSARTGRDAFKSIEPFSYEVLRPNPVFSQDALDLVMFSLERIDSWVEKMRGFSLSNHGGDYKVFQGEDHITEVPSPTNPSLGPGVVMNSLVTSLQGVVGETPFTNSSDCLSILDRRFWILDSQLDREGFTDPDDAFGQRPVLPDLISEVLDTEDRIRDLRFSWVDFRTNLVNGSLQELLRAQESLPEELRKQRELQAQRRSFGF